MMPIPPLITNGQYPLLDVFWTMLWFFLWIFLLVRVISDVFRSQDLSGWGKAAWIVLVIVLPFLGVLAYVVVRGHKMQENDRRQAEAADSAFRSYVQSAAGTPASTADEIAKLAALRDQGHLSEEEYQAQKAKVLGTAPTADVPGPSRGFDATR